jgi:hypothetical protein
VPTEPCQRKEVTSVSQQHFRIGHAGSEGKPVTVRPILTGPSMFLGGLHRELAQARGSIPPITVHADVFEKAMQLLRRNPCLVEHSINIQLH